LPKARCQFRLRGELQALPRIEEWGARQRHWQGLSPAGRALWGPHYQERCHPSQSQTRGLDGAEQCVVTARRSRLMSEGG
jgi:hypothetical protein